MTVTTANELSVDTSRGDQLQIHVRRLECLSLLPTAYICMLWSMCALQFDITFPGLPCEWISLDLMDISGEMHLDVVGPLKELKFFTDQYCSCIPNMCQLGCACPSLNVERCKIWTGSICSDHFLFHLGRLHSMMQAATSSDSDAYIFNSRCLCAVSRRVSN